MGMSHITKSISFYDKVTYLVDQRKPVDEGFSDFRKGFDTLLHSILLDKMSITPLDKSMLHWVSNWLLGQVPRVTVK